MNICDSTHTLVVTSADISGSTFTDVSLQGARFSDVNLPQARFSDVNLSDSKFSAVDLATVEIADGNVTGMTIHGTLVSEFLAT